LVRRDFALGAVQNIRRRRYAAVLRAAARGVLLFRRIIRVIFGGSFSASGGLSARPASSRQASKLVKRALFTHLARTRQEKLRKSPQNYANFPVIMKNNEKVRKTCINYAKQRKLIYSPNQLIRKLITWIIICRRSR
jgi:hypothetical protein